MSNMFNVNHFSIPFCWSKQAPPNVILLVHRMVSIRKPHPSSVCCAAILWFFLQLQGDLLCLGIQAEPTPFRDDRVGKLAHHKLRNVALRQMYLETEILFPKNHLNLLLCEFGAIVLTQRNVYGNVFPGEILHVTIIP